MLNDVLFIKLYHCYHEAFVHRVGCFKIRNLASGYKKLKIKLTGAKWIGPLAYNDLPKIATRYEYKVIFCKRCFRDIYERRWSKNENISL